MERKTIERSLRVKESKKEMRKKKDSDHHFVYISHKIVFRKKKDTLTKDRERERIGRKDGSNLGVFIERENRSSSSDILFLHSFSSSFISLFLLLPSLFLPFTSFFARKKRIRGKKDSIILPRMNKSKKKILPSFLQGWIHAK